MCRADAHLHGVVDFNRTTATTGSPILPLCGKPVYYHRCGRCGHLFTVAFDDWTREDWRANVYDSDYVLIDPDYASRRPQSNAKLLGRMFAADASRLRVLDWGSGSGVLARSLLDAGFAATASYDQFTSDQMPEPAAFDVVGCFEVLEHLTDPHAATAAMGRALTPDGVVVMSTCTQPEGANVGVDWWYVGPRNGHVSLFTKCSLALTWEAAGFTLHSTNATFHLASRGSPRFVDHLLKRR